jgi:hypothetical protein
MEKITGALQSARDSFSEVQVKAKIENEKNAAAANKWAAENLPPPGAPRLMPNKKDMKDWRRRTLLDPGVDI